MTRDEMKEAVMDGIHLARVSELAAAEEARKPSATPADRELWRRREAYYQGRRAALEAVLDLCTKRRRKR